MICWPVYSFAPLRPVHSAARHIGRGFVRHYVHHPLLAATVSIVCVGTPPAMLPPWVPFFGSPPLPWISPGGDVEGYGPSDIGGIGGGEAGGAFYSPGGGPEIGPAPQAPLPAAPLLPETPLPDVSLASSDFVAVGMTGFDQSVVPVTEPGGLVVFIAGVIALLLLRHQRRGQHQ